MTFRARFQRFLWGALVCLMFCCLALLQFYFIFQPHYLFNCFQKGTPGDFCTPLLSAGILWNGDKSYWASRCHSWSEGNEGDHLQSRCAAKGEAALLDIDDYTLHPRHLFPHTFYIKSGADAVVKWVWINLPVEAPLNCHPCTTNQLNSPRMCDLKKCHYIIPPVNMGKSGLDYNTNTSDTRFIFWSFSFFSEKKMHISIKWLGFRPLVDCSHRWGRRVQSALTYIRSIPTIVFS